MLAPMGCRTRGSNAFVIALGDNVRTIDPIGAPAVEAASERVRSLMFNTLVKKDEKFDYVGELASDIKRSDDGLSFTFTLRDGVKFHDGRALTSADVKYTLDLVFTSNFGKSASFYEGTGDQKRSLIKSVEAPDQRTVVVTMIRPWVGLLSNLVPIAIIPKDSYESQKEHPLGSGPFKFVRYDNAQQVCDVEAFPEYWDGPSKLQHVRVRVISDMNALQAELQSGRVDIAPLPTSLSSDAVKRLEQDPNLQVRVFPGSNLALLTGTARSRIR
jgi:peptide/nickel transport system substrate-binding protein